MNDMPSHLTVVTVVYNNYTILDEYFASLNAQTDTNFHVYVSDLSDRPQTYAYPSYVTMGRFKNGGYAFGVNRGIRYAIREKSDGLIVTNCDTTVSPTFIETAKKSLGEHPGTIIGGKIYYYPGYEFHSDRYTDTDRGKVLWYAGGTIDWKHAITPHRGVDEVDSTTYSSSQPTEFITGCLMAFDLSVVKKIGKWNERYFLYYEDADYCVRAKRAGIALLYEPNLIMWHKNAQSTDGSGSDFHRICQLKSQLRFGLRYAPLRTKIHLFKNFLYAKRPKK